MADPDAPSSGEIPPSGEGVVAERGEMFTERDGVTDSEAEVTNAFSDEAITATGAGVRIEGGIVTLCEAGSYLLRGTLSEGQVIVDAPADAKLQLVLDGVSIRSATSAALYVRGADKVFVTLVGENRLENGGAFAASDEAGIDGALFARDDLTLNGEGSLTVLSPAGHGIVCKDDLVLSGGQYTVQAAAHALSANDSIRVREATVTAEAGKDGLHAESGDAEKPGFVYIESGVLTIRAEGDGISAEQDLQIIGGEVDILAGGGHEKGESHTDNGPGGFGGGGWPGGRPRTAAATESGEVSRKGLKAGGDLTISGGRFTLDTADDALHADRSLTVSGGVFAIASGDDALHAEETLCVSGGELDITASYEGLEALHLSVEGGTIRIVADDDGINAAGGTDNSGGFGGFGGFGGGNSNGSVVISGGTLFLKASGDGIDANGTLEITGGHTIVCGPTQGDTAVLDYDKSGIITGGTFIGTGSSMMAQSLTGSEQGVLALSVGSQSAGTAITLRDAAGKTLVAHEPELSYQIVILSTPEMRAGESYTITVGSLTGEFAAN